MSLKSFIADRLTTTKLGLRCYFVLYKWLYHLKRGKLASIPEKTSSSKRFFFDVTSLVTANERSGIPRVMYKLAQQWLQRPPDGYIFAPICSDGLGYRYVDTEKLFDKVDSFCKVKLLNGVDAGGGDIFLSVDIMSTRINIEEPIIKEWRRRGVKVYWTVHDLIPYREPADTSTQRKTAIFKDMLDMMIAYGDGIVCVSRYVADDLMSYIKEQGVDHPPLPIGYAHNGTDLRSNKFLGGNIVRDKRKFLMVGTLTWRKRYHQVIDAFDKLWSDGVNAVLLIIGRAIPGMKGADELAAMVRQHPEFGRLLIWNDDASDDDLMRAYAESGALIYASFTEGFGLPLIEAAQNDLPIIARDLPLYHEVCGDHAYYFEDSNDPQVIADAVEKWIELDECGKAPQSKGMPYLTWEESAEKWKEVIFGGKWLLGSHSE